MRRNPFVACSPYDCGGFAESAKFYGTTSMLYGTRLHNKTTNFVTMLVTRSGVGNELLTLLPTPDVSRSLLTMVSELKFSELI